LNKKERIIDLALTLEYGGMQPDKISTAILHSSEFQKLKVSKTYLRQCLPEKYKRQTIKQAAYFHNITK
jgi:hypothetical protein